MEITEFVSSTTLIPLAELTRLAANRACFGDDVLAAFATQVELRSAAAQAVLREAETAGRDTLLASEQRSYDGAIRERDSLLALQQAVERRTEQRAFVPPTQAPAIHVPRTDGKLFGLEARALVENTGAGSYVVPEDYRPQFFDLLAAESVALRAGMPVITTNRDVVKVPRVLSDPTAAWTDEAGLITPSDPNYHEVEATPRKLAALTVVSNELLADSNPSIVAMLERQMVRALSLELDRAIFKGSGTPPEITGLDNVSNTQTDSGTLANLDDIADAITGLEAANAKATAIFMHPLLWGTLIKVKEADTSNNKPLLQDSAGSGAQGVQRSIYGVPVYLSSQLVNAGSPSAPDTIYVCDTSQMVLVRRQEIRIDVDRSRLFNYDQSEIRAILRADLVVPNPAAVYVLTV